MEWITFRCTGCQQGLKIGADKAGRTVKCSKCGTVLTVPTTVNKAPAGDARPTAPVEAPAPSGDSPPENRKRPGRGRLRRPREVMWSAHETSLGGAVGQPRGGPFVR